MPLDPAAVGAASRTKVVSWTPRDCMLYALGVGAGIDDLEYTTNNTRGVEQRMLPTMPVTLGVDFSVLKQAGEIDWTKLLHAEQEIELLDELPVTGSAQVTTRLVHLWDKDPAALVVAETEGTTEAGNPLWRSRASLFIKGAGGWGGDRGPASAEAMLPEQPDATLTYATRPDQALLYRLSGDENPLHSDPAFAARAGLDRPILHGLATFGFAGRAVLAFAGPGRASLRTLKARFASPVWPGDTLNVDLWNDDESVHFTVRGRDDRVVLSGGRATFDESRP